MKITRKVRFVRCNVMKSLDKISKIVIIKVWLLEKIT